MRYHFCQLGALGSLIGGAASVAKAVNDSKAARHQLEAATSRSRDGAGSRYLVLYKYEHGLYLGSYKHGQGVTAKKKKCRKDNKNTVWHNYQCAIERTRRRMRVPYFRVFMCNMLSTSGAHRNESIVNLDNTTGPGTHWVAYAKRNNRVVYFDSFGNLRSPKELVRYFGNESL